MTASTDDQDIAEDSDSQIQMINISPKKGKLSADVEVQGHAEPKSTSASPKKSNSNSSLFQGREGTVYHFTLKALAEIKIRSNTAA
ncbi:hypothetical protein N7508_006482 [Penicillium antarcticum]|uniref:uncharacterized protein n=1 Tax=Penicillium antarcticum TaxID=416450 RepID=UPI00239F94F2|nr:uncharacterized protein N7508_006482 [Penicillium antarcticum]KAJ5301619.1 hypothetical protein N7508_006482 [Penicillium antarcticum]